METSTALRRFDHTQGPRIVGPTDGVYRELQTIGARMMVWTEETGGGFSLVEHPIPPHSLAAPVHKHSREDEYSFVLEGRMGALLGDVVVYADAGNVGSERRFEYTVIGDPVNEAARLSELAKQRATGVVASDRALDRASPIEAEEWERGERTVLRGRLEATVLARPRANGPGERSRGVSPGT